MAGSSDSSAAGAPAVQPRADVPREVGSLLDAGGVTVEVRGRRADVVLASPGNRNAQGPATWRALAAAAGWLDGVVDVVVLGSQGPTFSAGLDRRAFTPEGIPGELSLSGLARLDDERLDHTLAAYQQGLTCWSAQDVVAVAAVQGEAVGAGFQLALAADLRIAADDARFSMREATFGLVPDLGGTHPLVAAVGYPRALDICVTGRWVTAAEAAVLGIVQQVVPADRLGGTVDALVTHLLELPPGTLRATKRLLRGAVERGPAEQLAQERRTQAGRLRHLAGVDRPTG